MARKLHSAKQLAPEAKRVLLRMARDRDPESKISWDLKKLRDVLQREMRMQPKDADRAIGALEKSGHVEENSDLFGHKIKGAIRLTPKGKEAAQFLS